MLGGWGGLSEKEKKRAHEHRQQRGDCWGEGEEKESIELGKVVMEKNLKIK